MALPNSGPLSLNQIHVEAGGSSNTEASINDSDIRGLIGKSSGAQMSFNEWYGATNTVTVSQTISSSTNNYNIASSRPGTYSAGNTAFTLTVNPGVTIGTNSTSASSLSMGTPWTSGDTVTINNYGTLKGGGGPGGKGGNSGFNNGNAATPGTTVNGAALTLTYPATVGNYGSIYGGGGGGGGGGSVGVGSTTGKFGSAISVSAGGGGGGAGVNAGSGGPGGPPSSPVSTNANRTGDSGSGGNANAGGAGGIGKGSFSFSFPDMPNAKGGAGGGLGSNGASGTSNTVPSPNPFSNFNPGSNPQPAGSGGTRGYYISGNSYATWSPQGTVGGRSA